MNGKWDGMRILWIGAITLIVLLLLPYLGIFSIFIEPPDNSNEQFNSSTSRDSVSGADDTLKEYKSVAPTAEYLVPETDQPPSNTIQQPERNLHDPLLELLERK